MLKGAWDWDSNSEGVAENDIICKKVEGNDHYGWNALSGRISGARTEFYKGKNMIGWRYD